MPATVDALFLAAVKRYPQRSFLRYLDDSTDHRVSYREASVRFALTVSNLQRLDIRSGDRIVCYVEDIVPSLFIQLACAHAGVVAVFLAPSASLEALTQLAARVDSRAFFTTPEHAHRLSELGQRVLTFSEKPLGAGIEALSQAPDGLAAAEALHLLEAASAGHGADEVYGIQPTSGTTGQPKLVVRPHRSPVRGGRQFILGGMKATDEPPHRILLCAALTHALGQTVLSTALHLAAELDVPAHNALGEIRALDPHYLVMPPRILRSLYDAHMPSPDRLFGASARILMVAGSAPEIPLLRYLEKQAVDVVDMYGSSETGTLAINPPGQWREGYSGKILDDVTLRIDLDGEILARSPGQMLGYAGDEAQTREVYTADGFYKMGDFGEITADGYLKVLGRKKDVFNTSDGSNIYPARIETAIEGFDWTQQAVLLGDQRPFLSALIVVKDGLAGAATVDGEDGLLDQASASALYARARADLAALNETLESNERIHRFMLFARPLPPKLYSTVTLGKIQRDRKGIGSSYAARIGALYSPTVASTCAVVSAPGRGPG